MAQHCSQGHATTFRGKQCASGTDPVQRAGGVEPGVGDGDEGCADHAQIDGCRRAGKRSSADGIRNDGRMRASSGEGAVCMGRVVQGVEIHTSGPGDEVEMTGSTGEGEHNEGSQPRLVAVTLGRKVLGFYLTDY